ncbi:unnamed protein product [Prorocentrum cordatum]|uniref:Uncharacterized protein n=1 Tax=Prorocentrum cordatum TaxID=2364126 RepID=A0ABN9VUK7_9DINO|nr:unnamed protein product [Polarella glacialis]
MNTDKFRKKKKRREEGAAGAPLVADGRDLSVSSGGGQAGGGSAPPPAADQEQAGAKEGTPFNGGAGDLATQEAEQEGHDGIVKQGCTDVACLVLFLAVLGLMGWLTHYASAHGDIQKLHHGIDWAGEVCGFGPAVLAKPYLYWCGDGSYTDITQEQGNETVLVARIPTALNMDAPICVETCPSGSEVVFCPSDAHVTRTVTGESPEIVMTTVIKREVKGQASYPTSALAGAFCLPDLATDEDGDENSERRKAALGDLQVKIHEWLDKSWASILMVSFGHLAEDIPNVLPLLCGICVITFVMSFVYLLMLRWLAKLTIYLIIILTALVFFSVAVSLIVTAHDLTGHQHLSPLFKHIAAHHVAVIVSDAVGVVFLLLGVSVTIVACCMHDTVEMVCGCVEAACECMFDMPTLFLEPVAAGALKLAILCGLLYGFAQLVSVGDVESKNLDVGGTAVRGINRKLTFSEDRCGYTFFCTRSASSGWSRSAMPVSSSPFPTRRFCGTTNPSGPTATRSHPGSRLSAASSTPSSSTSVHWRWAPS